MKNAFRDIYLFPNDITWYVSWTASFARFPGHMTKALKTVKNLCKNVDLMVEVRDARVGHVIVTHLQIPLSSINPVIENTFQNKPRLVLLHRSDLIPKEDQRKLTEYYRTRNQCVLLTSTKTESNMNAIVPTLLSMQRRKFVSVGCYFAVMGIPNVGKSSIIRYIQRKSNDFLHSSLMEPVECRQESNSWRYPWCDKARRRHQGPFQA